MPSTKVGTCEKCHKKNTELTFCDRCERWLCDANECHPFGSGCDCCACNEEFHTWD